MTKEPREPRPAQPALTRLAGSHPDIEIWWDSSPLIFPAWAQQCRAGQKEARPRLSAEIDRFFDGPPQARLISGVTTNPPLCQQVIEDAPEAVEQYLRGLLAAAPDTAAYNLFWQTYREIVRRGAARMQEVFEASGHTRGFLSGQVDPRLLNDTEAMLAQAHSLRQAAPNIMIKMPGTAQGIEGIRRLTAQGIATNATLTFTVSQLVAVAEAVSAGLQEAQAHAVDLSCWRSVGTHMLGRFEDAAEFRRQAAGLHIELTETELRWAGLAVFGRICEIFKARGYATKPLAASMRLGPTIEGRRHIWHLEKLAASPVVLTIFPNIIEAFLEEYDDLELPAAPEPVPPAVLDKLLRIPYFAQAYAEDGLAPQDFASHPAAVETATSFSAATEEMEAWTQKVINA